MTSIYDIPYNDIQIFLDANNEYYDNKDDAYNKALSFLKDSNSKGHTTSIIEWLIAHNLLINKVKISNYKVTNIDNMTQYEINKLAKLLTMKGNNIGNIKNILRYLHKLNEVELITDIKEIILLKLEELEINELNFDNMTEFVIFKLLENHRNKSLIRKLIYNHMEKIIFNRFLPINVGRLNDLTYYIELSDKLPKSIIFKLLNHNQEKIVENYGIGDIDDVKNYLENSHYDKTSVDIGGHMIRLSSFFVNLVKIDEMGLAKKILDISNDYNIGATIDRHYYHSLEEYLIERISGYEIETNVFNKFLDLIGEHNYIKQLEQRYIHNDTKVSFLKLLFNKLVSSKKYHLLINILELLIERNHRYYKIIDKMLPYLTNAIQSNDTELIARYKSILNSSLENGRLEM